MATDLVPVPHPPAPTLATSSLVAAGLPAPALHSDGSTNPLPRAAAVSRRRLPRHDRLCRERQRGPHRVHDQADARLQPSAGRRRHQTILRVPHPQTRAAHRDPRKAGAPRASRGANHPTISYEWRILVQSWCPRSRSLPTLIRASWRLVFQLIEFPGKTTMVRAPHPIPPHHASGATHAQPHQHAVSRPCGLCVAGEEHSSGGRAAGGGAGSVAERRALT